MTVELERQETAVDLERFDRFFAAVNDGAGPYPWQRDLVREIGETGRWPSAIAMPTGAGKSSVVDVHVFLVAERARQRMLTDRPAIARPPRRLVLVAPRRVLVEDQFERARRLAERLERPGDDAIVAEVAEALRSLCSADEEDGGAPLGVARLRGGVRLDLSWRLDPTQCQVICATPQMWGSRLLLRGFRGTMRARNLEAGLLGHDAAVVIDEAHLHERLVDTATRIARHGAGPLGLQVVAMSATRGGTDAVRLSDEDLQHDELRRRVRASKRVTVVEVDDWRRTAAETLAAEARRRAGRGTVGIFVNTVTAALDVAARLDGTVKVVCGRMRPADIERLRRAHPGLLDSSGNDEVDYLVATQSLEVGVDLDLPAVVTAIAPAAALAQRAGRLNRSGRRPEAELVVVAPRDVAGLDDAALDRDFVPYRGAEIRSAAEWVGRLAGDASPERVSETALPSEERLPLPPLTRVELETFAIAGHELAADADVAFYVDEPTDREERTVAICARAMLDLPEEVVSQALVAAPPRAHELASLPLGKPLERILAHCKHVWVLRGEQDRRQARRLSGAEEARPGDVIVVPDGSPICTAGVIGLTGRRAGSSLDDVMAERPDGPPDAVIELARDDVAPLLEADRTLGSRAARNALATLVAETGDADAATRLRTHRRLSDLDVTWCGDEEAETGLLVISPTGREGVLPTAPVAAEPVTVDDHCAAVEDRLRRVIELIDPDEHGLGVAPDALLAAARWHDAGKRHPRFQLRMGADPDGPPLAKPALGHTADRGDGWRHEQLSAGYAWAHTGRDPVATVLVGEHHGRGTPMFDRGPGDVLLGWDGCGEDVRAALDELFGAQGRWELERLRLIRSLGLHRLAHLVALVRCADMQVSREGR